MQEGKGGEAESMHPAALQHEHSKSHHIGKAFASAHSKDHQGGLPGVASGPAPGPTNNDSAGEFGQV